MSDTTTPNEDYSPPAQTLPQEWEQLKNVRDELTRQRDMLANRLREHQAGKGDTIDPLAKIQQAQRAILKAMPDLATSAAPGALPLDVSVNDLIASYWDTVKQRKNTASTGIAALDTILSGGIESSRLVTVLGAPNTGKTTFTHQLADHIANAGRPVLYVTSEDSPPALFAKTLARIGGVNYTAVLKGWESERAKIDQALALQMDRMSRERLRYLDASNGVTLPMIRERAEEHFNKYRDVQGGGPGVLVIDYLQRIARAIKTRASMTQDLREIVTLVTEELRALACDLDCGVIAIASQKRESYTRGDQGAMASAKESGDIEYTCDVLMALSEDKDKNRVAPAGMTPIMLYVDKNRQGQRGKSVALDFWPDRQQFTVVEE